MSSTQPFGGPRLPASASGNSHKRAAESIAPVSENADDTFTKRSKTSPHLPHAVRRPSSLSDLALAFIPTPGSSCDDASVQLNEAVGIPLIDLPAAPPIAVPPIAVPLEGRGELEAALNHRETLFLATVGRGATPAQALAQCFRMWMRHGSHKLDLNALQKVLLAIGERDGMHNNDFRMRDALRITSLIRSTFGDTVEPKARAPLHSCLRLSSSDTQATPESAWDRRTHLLTHLKKLREGVAPIHRDMVSKKFLAAHVRNGSGHAMMDFLGYHTRLAMTLCDFATFALSARTDAWLQNADWGRLSAMTNIVAQSGLTQARMLSLLDAIFKLRRNDIEQIEQTMTRLRCGVDDSTAQIIELAFLLSIEKLGYNAVLACKNLLVCPLEPEQRLALTTALYRFNDPRVALLAAQVTHTALINCSKQTNTQKEIIELFAQQAGYYLEARQDVLGSLETHKLSRLWLLEMLKLRDAGYTPESLADVAAAKLLLGGHVDGRQMVFKTGETSWHTDTSQIPLLLQAAQQLGMIGQSRLFVGWLNAGIGQAIVDTGGGMASLVQSSTYDLHLRIAYAQALASVPPELMAACLSDVAQLAQDLQIGPSALVPMVDKMMYLAKIDAIDTTYAFAHQLLARAPRRPIEQVMPEAMILASDAHPLVCRLQNLCLSHVSASAQRDDAMLLVAMSAAQYHLSFPAHAADAARRLQRLIAACEPYFTEDITQARLNALLQAELRLGDALPKFLERVRALSIPKAPVWLIVSSIGRLPINGVLARIFLGAFSTDQVLARLAGPQDWPAKRAFITQVFADTRARMADTQNVHPFLRGLDGATAHDSQVQLATILAFIDQLTAQAPSDSVWFRRRGLRSRNTLDNARYVLTGPYHAHQDLSRSVAETPNYLDVCGLVWRAIDRYKHPSGETQATAHEQKLMREDVVLGLAECTQDETGYRVCPVGFKQRVVGILQGDDRYPQVLVDATNAAQMLTVVAQEFAVSLDGRDPTQAQLAGFLRRTRDLAKARFSDEPRELDKFTTQLDAWVAMDYDYEPAASSPA